MGKAYLRSGLCTIMLFLFTFNLSAIDFSLKLAGGLSHMRLDSVNQSILDWVAWQKKNAETQNRWNYLGGKITELHQSFDFEGEILLSLNTLFSLGISAGFIYGEITNDDTQLTIERLGNQYLYTFPTKVNAYPIILSGYFNFPIIKWLKAYIKGGAGILWAKFFNSEGRKLIKEGATYNYPTSQEASSRGAIYTGAIGVFIQTEAGIDFFLEGSLRRSKIKGFQGENKNNVIGKLYTYEEYAPLIDIWQTKINIHSASPVGESIRSAGETEIDLGGLSFKTGIIIKF